MTSVEDPRDAVAATLREERKLVTVLFADLTGYTALAASLDPEEVYASLRPGILELQRVVEGFGGTVPQVLGDGFMAVFGVPGAHEDDAERAVRAALAVRERARELRAGGGGVPFPEVHAGVNSGEVIVVPAAEAAGFAVIGDTVNTASRLADLAPPGSVLVDRRTRNRTSRSIRYGRGRLRRAKGKPEGLLAYEAIEPLTPVPGGRPFGSGPFVDREAELEALDRAFRGAVRAGRSRVSLLVGEPGLGKTRLASELRARWPAAVAFGRCAAFGAREPLQALVLAVTEAVGVLPGPAGPPGPARLDQAARRLAAGRDVRPLARDLRLLATIAGGGAGGSLPDAASAIRRVVEGLASAGPTAVILDDLQWADPELLRLIAEAGADPWRGPILLLGLARPGVRLPGIPALELHPLDPASGRKLASAILGPAAPDEVLGVVLDRAAGNPFFLEESLAMLIEAGSLRREPGGWRLRDPDALARVPSSVRLLIAARIDGLPGEEKLVLREASVAGERVWDELLARGRGLPAARRALDGLIARGLLRRRERSQLPGVAEYEFRHVLIRDVAYESLARSERARRHLQVAGWLRERTGDLVREPVALIAEHYERAWRLGQGGAEVARFAVSYLRRWADDVRTYHPRAAEAVARRALEIVRAGSVGAAEEGELLATRAEALIEMGRHDEALREAARAERLAVRAGDRGLLARALLARGRALSDRGRTRDARPLLRRARRLFRGAGNLAGEGWAAHALSETMVPEDQERQLRLLREAEELFARARDERGRAATVQSLAYVLTIRGGAQFRRWHAEARRLGTEEGDEYAQAMALRSWGYFLHYRGDHAAAIAAMRAVRPLALESGDRYVEADAILIEAASRALVGDLDEAERLVEEALELGRAVGSARIRAMALVAGARAALRGGRPGEARERLRAARRLLHPPTRLEVVDHLAAEAGMLLDAGRFGPLPRIAARLEAGVRATGWRLWQPLAPLALGRAQLASGDPREAEVTLRRAVLVAARVGAEGHAALARALLGEARVLGGRSPGARPEAEQTDAEADAVGLETEGLRLLPRDPPAAAEVLQRAAERWRSLGLTVWLPRALALRAGALERAGGVRAAAAARREAAWALDVLGTPAAARARLLEPLRAAAPATGGSGAGPARGSARRAGPAR
ncbi:MAG TPA: adenylate/guanylate cyclase domain-containing protein [Actinomycetota bacterium]|nr:adenylate/guanylate cyclase domain-containing protein [Actinomycetota bacterium]